MDPKCQVTGCRNKALAFLRRGGLYIERRGDANEPGYCVGHLAEGLLAAQERSTRSLSFAVHPSRAGAADQALN